MKNQIKFKVGDRVYCPSISLNVLEVLPVDDWQMKNKTPIRLPTINDNIVLFLTELGVDIYSKMPVIVHATQENYELLSKLYSNVTFEPPPSKEPKEVIEAMLASGAILIPCLVVDHDDNRILDYKKVTRHSPSVLIYGISENGRFLSTNPHCSSYKYAVPFDIKTRKVIVDYIDGIEVLED